MLRFFVTGGRGFIGSAFISSAVELGHSTFNYDIYHHEDLGDRQQLVQALNAYGPDWIIHLAATPGVASAMDVGIRDVINTQNLLDAAAQLVSAPSILFASTGSVYGRQWNFPTIERAPMAPQQSHYANAKLMCEGMISLYAQQYGVRASTLRLGTIIGPGNKKGFIKDFVERLQKDPTKLKTWGDGCQIKSYLHIDDLVSAMWQSMSAVMPVETFNVAHDRGASIRECIPWICDELGVNPEIEYGTEESGTFGDIPTIRLSNAKLRGIGWAPSKSIEDAVRENVRTLRAASAIASAA